MKRTNRAYQGVHEPLISKGLFDRVQKLKSNKQIKKSTRHNHTFRRLVSCGHCGRSLYGELQKGHVYMRCQTKGCPTKTVREDRLEAEIGAQLMACQIEDLDKERLNNGALYWLTKPDGCEARRAIKLQLAKLDQREEQLTDALLDSLIDKDTFQKRKASLLEERWQLEKAAKESRDIASDEQSVREFLELAKSVGLTYQFADRQKKHRLTEVLFSNRTLTGQSLYLEPQKWLRDKEWAIDALCGPPDPTRTRTKEEILALIDELKVDATNSGSA